MISTKNKPENDKKRPSETLHIAVSAPAAAPSVKSPSTATQKWLPSKIVTHHPKAGLNPLVDAAAYLFTVMGKLKQVSHYRNLTQLQKELIEEITLFQESAKNLGYNAEYTLVCRYALCATLDDIILNTAWGDKGQWESYNLLKAFKQDNNQQEKFFFILERLMKNPKVYADLMEFMYLCLSLGFKGHFRSTEFSHNQLEQIMESLYRHIRSQRGNFNKALSPVAVKAPITTAKIVKLKPSIAFPLLVSGCIILSVFIGFGFLLDNVTTKTSIQLAQIANTTTYES